MRIYIEVHPNEEVRDLHLDRPITVKPYSKYSDKGVPKKVERLERKFAEAIEFKDDMVSSRVGRKEIRLERNPVFTWEQVQNKAIEILEAYFKVEVTEVEVMPRNPEWDRPRAEREEW